MTQFLMTLPPGSRRALRCAAVFALTLCCALEGYAAEREIAITFDDAPRSDGPFFSGEQRTAELIAALASADVDSAMFFVTTNGLVSEGESGRERIRQYAAAGHELASHSHSHPWLHRTDVSDYLADIDRSLAMLSEFDNVQPFFRFPYLDEGRSVEKRVPVAQGLVERGLQNGYVTVDNYDWYMAALAREIVDSGAEPDLNKLRDAYVESLLDVVEFYDGIAREALGRSPKHVLLLHENDLAALFVGDLVAALRNNGWQIIPASAAYTDPIANMQPETLFLGQGRVAALAVDRGWSRRDLVHLTEDEQQLREEFQRRGLLAE